VKKIIGFVCAALGAFLIVAGITADVWATDTVEKTPLDVDSITRLDGTASRIDTENGGTVDFDVRVASFNKADSDASTDDVVVFESNTCLVKDIPDTPDCGVKGVGDDADPNVINVSDPFVFATDRRTAEAVAATDLPETTEVEGLVNKWPFGAQQQDYQIWDGVLGRAVTATYEGSEALEGLDTYVYNVSLTDEPAEVIPGTDGLYSQDKTYWVEPATGSIIKQAQVEERTLEDGTVLLALDVAFTDEQVTSNVADSTDSADSLKLITSTVPTVGYAAGIPLLLVGLALLALSRRRKPSQEA